MFKLSIDKELSLRQFSYDDPENPQFVFKDADSMSPEEKEHLKGDTIDYKSLSEKGVAQSFSEAVSQFQQEQLLRVKPLRVNVLDSVFRKELSCHNLFFSNCVVIRFDRDMVVVDSVGTCPLYDLGVVTTDLRPIGLYAAQFVQAKVQLKPTTIMMELLYNLMISFGIAVFIIAVLYYQLVIIERGRRVLKGRESAVYNAIHDLKSPLNGTFALLDAVSGIVKGDAMMVDSLRKGKSQIKRMTEMIESMLDTTLRIDSGTLLKINRIDLVGMVRMLEEEIPLNFSNKRYVFRVEDRLKESWIWTDRVLLERCLRNLIENALKYSDDGVVITVSLSQDEEYVHISVKDTGWGIPKEMQKKLVNSFLR